MITLPRRVPKLAIYSHLLSFTSSPGAPLQIGPLVVWADFSVPPDEEHS